MCVGYKCVNKFSNELCTISSDLFQCFLYIGIVSMAMCLDLWLISVVQTGVNLD